MDKLEYLKQLIEILEVDLLKFYNKGNKAASIRARKTLQKIRQESLDLRKDISLTRKTK